MNSSKDPLAKVATGWEQVRRWREVARTSEATDDRLDRWEGELTTTADQLVLEDLDRFTQAGHAVTLELDQDAWSAEFYAAEGHIDLRHSTAGLEQVFSEAEDLRSAQRAIEDEEGRRLLELCAKVRCSCRLTWVLMNDPSVSGLHWVASMSALVEHCSTHTWFGLVKALFANRTSEGEVQPQRLVIQDAGEAVWRARGVVVHGPDIRPELPKDDFAEDGAEFRRRRLNDEREGLPPPSAFQAAVADSPPESLKDIEPLFRQFAHRLAWLWLANDFTIEANRVRVSFGNGDRRIDLDLTEVYLKSAPSEPEVGEALTLWREVVDPPDSLRFTALQRAVCVTVRTAADLKVSAKPVLRTTHLLHRIAEQGAVQEAFSVRESARKAALDAARSTAEAVSATTRSVVDRTFAQLVLIAGVVAGYQEDLIKEPVALIVLALIFVVGLVTGGVAFGFELPAVRAARRALKTDLGQYRDSLTTEEIKSIESMENLRVVDRQLKLSSWLVGILLVVQVLVIWAVASWVQS